MIAVAGRRAAGTRSRTGWIMKFWQGMRVALVGLLNLSAMAVLVGLAALLGGSPMGIVAAVGLAAAVIALGGMLAVDILLAVVGVRELLERAEQRALEEKLRVDPAPPAAAAVAIGPAPRPAASQASEQRQVRRPVAAAPQPAHAARPAQPPQQKRP